MNLTVPELSLILLVGPSGCGKSTFAARHFLPTEVISSDYCRGLVSDDENDQSASKDAFELVHFIAAKRLAAGRLTVIDATNVQPESRAPLIALARRFHVLPVAIVLDVDEEVCHARNASRANRDFGPHVVRNQARSLRKSLRGLEREGFRYVHILDSQEKIEQARIERQPLWNNRKYDHGPFDIIGDVHGCFEELCDLLTHLGYEVDRVGHSAVPPVGRRALFVGDLVDRGPDTPGVLKIAMSMVASNHALCVPGNHDVKLVKKLKGRDVKVSHGLAESIEQLEREPAEFRRKVTDFLDALVSHYVLDDGKLVVAHAGMKQEYQGRGSAIVRDFALYGETSGETDEFGLPIRYAWAQDYRGSALVVYGHTPVPEPEMLNNTVNIDTGCVFGGKLTAYRYPEHEFISVKARIAYYESPKPFVATPTLGLSAQQRHDELLAIEDVQGKRIVNTRLMPAISIREENATAALEVLSRFAANPKWLIYLPPTMSPSEASKLPEYLEHPKETFSYFRAEGIGEVICEEKHMGSRAVVVLCRDAEAARRRFGVTDDGIGICYTRTGRRFFDDSTLEAAFLARLATAAERASLFGELKTDWLCLDCELMPWSAKAQELLRRQYAPAGAAGRATLAAVVDALATTSLPGSEALLAEQSARLDAVARYSAAYGRYCWPVRELNDLKLAPFHVLASEGRVHVDQDHTWHLKLIEKFCESDSGLLRFTKTITVDLSDATSEEAATLWWEQLTETGGEGMVIKPAAFLAKGRRGYVQPAVKCRGREYLRIIYGPEYTRAENLSRLRHRHLGSKRSLASREFALGIEGLERFVRKEPLRRVHECILGVLALESEPVDPRL